MTKADLIDEVSKIANLTKKETETIVNTIFDNITDALSKGDKVELRGFGSFRIRHRNSRKGRNPRPAAPWTFPRSAFPSSKSASACESSSTREGPPGAVKRLWAPWRMAWVRTSRPPPGLV